MLEDEREARQEAARRAQGRPAATASGPFRPVRPAAAGGFLLSAPLSFARRWCIEWPFHATGHLEGTSTVHRDAPVISISECVLQDVSAR